MAFNGDGPHTKRQRTETDSANNRVRVAVDRSEAVTGGMRPLRGLPPSGPPANAPPSRPRFGGGRHIHCFGLGAITSPTK
ncbi:hypothetical protein GEV33_003500 [Tenebrio molitor]|uniref:Uncharacterized protein n=1 Tax=Tenebrio molitor TaxID=7067 RepID=A0A8J6LNI3_TENMO|nr:hypothetical protein GEV33_003500 [Tenebrio molitor]